MQFLGDFFCGFVRKDFFLSNGGSNEIIEEYVEIMQKLIKKRVCHKSMAHPLLCYLLHNPRSIVAYSKKGIILYRLQILLFPIFSIINRQEVHKRA